MADEKSTISADSLTNGGKGAYGTVHVMEEEMKAKGDGTFADAKPARKSAPAKSKND